MKLFVTLAILCNYLLFSRYYLAAIALSLECSDTENYVKAIKQSRRYAEEESYEIKSGSTTVAESITLTSQALQTFEYCVPKNTNDQYTVVMKDSYGDSWFAPISRFAASTVTYSSRT